MDRKIEIIDGDDIAEGLGGEAFGYVPKDNLICQVIPPSVLW